MAESIRRFFTALVVGENHKEIMDRYSSTRKVEQYVKYKYLDAKKYLNGMVKALSAICEDSRKSGFSQEQLEVIKTRMATLKNMSPFEYYQMITEGMFYDENGNALSDENPEMKYSSCQIGDKFSVPFKLLDGTESYSARKGDIDWSKMHFAAQRLYERVWEIAVDGDEPQNSEEEVIKATMSDKQNYFSTFKSKDAYVTYSTAYWAYAIVDENGWTDVDGKENGDMQTWIESFYDRYIKDMSDDKLLTIYECATL